jgi:hypothetical protein
MGVVVFFHRSMHVIWVICLRHVEPVRHTCCDVHTSLTRRYCVMFFSRSDPRIKSIFRDQNPDDPFHFLCTCHLPLTCASLDETDILILKARSQIQSCGNSILLVLATCHHDTPYESSTRFRFWRLKSGVAISAFWMPAIILSDASGSRNHAFLY